MGDVPNDDPDWQDTLDMLSNWSADFDTEEEANAFVPRYEYIRNFMALTRAILRIARVLRQLGIHPFPIPRWFDEEEEL